VTGFLWGALGFFGGLGVAALGDLVSEEVRDRLDHLPHAILRLAARRLDAAQCITVYEDEWLPELTYVLKGDEARPVTRVYHGTRFALGILLSVNHIARQLDRPVSAARYDCLAFEAIVARVVLDENVQLANLNRILHGLETDPKTTTFAAVDRQIILAQTYGDALSRLARSKTATRRQRRELPERQDVLRRRLQALHVAQAAVEAHYEARSGEGEQAE
jgi:hypothetical protein